MIIIKKGTKRLIKDRKEIVLGEMYNPEKESNKSVATIELIKNNNLSINDRFFNSFIF